MTKKMTVVDRVHAAIDRNAGDIEKTRAWLEIFDRAALDMLDQVEEDILLDEDMDADGACVCCPERSES